MRARIERADIGLERLEAIKVGEISIESGAKLLLTTGMT